MFRYAAPVIWRTLPGLQWLLCLLMTPKDWDRAFKNGTCRISLTVINHANRQRRQRYHMYRPLVCNLLIFCDHLPPEFRENPESPPNTRYDPCTFTGFNSALQPRPIFPALSRLMVYRTGAVTQHELEALLSQCCAAPSCIEVDLRGLTVYQTNRQTNLVQSLSPLWNGCASLKVLDLGECQDYTGSFDHEQLTLQVNKLLSLEELRVDPKFLTRDLYDAIGMLPSLRNLTLVGSVFEPFNTNLSEALRDANFHFLALEELNIHASDWTRPALLSLRGLPHLFSSLKSVMIQVDTREFSRNPDLLLVATASSRLKRLTLVHRSMYPRFTNGTLSLGPLDHRGFRQLELYNIALSASGQISTVFCNNPAWRYTLTDLIIPSQHVDADDLYNLAGQLPNLSYLSVTLRIEYIPDGPSQTGPLSQQKLRLKSEAWPATQELEFIQ
ncbi:hypothetical protein RhiLY_03614 [Ceratobasidium sp. AG-Ba]|nr:hypothetical protein RhiLY_03614 [Ceratobasidium sp. AG-Ba]